MKTSFDNNIIVIVNHSTVPVVSLSYYTHLIEYSTHNTHIAINKYFTIIVTQVHIIRFSFNLLETTVLFMVQPVWHLEIMWIIYSQ